MTSRGRAVGFASAAALCAGLAASSTGARPAGLEGQFGELHEVLVASAPLAAGEPLKAKTLTDSVEVRRVPESFLPPGALSEADQLSGRRLATDVPAGSYLVASQLRIRGSDVQARDPRLQGAERPVEIAVDGAAALAQARGAAARMVDVVVTSEPGPGGGAGRTYIAAEAVELLALQASTASDPDAPLPVSPVDSQIATLALSRSQALRLIQAESFARSVRLISH